MAERKPDVMKAQEMLRSSLKRVAIECGINKDPATFLVLMMVATSALVAEMTNPTKLLEDNGESVIKFAIDELNKYLRQDLDGRIKHERKKGMH